MIENYIITAYKPQLTVEVNTLFVVYCNLRMWKVLISMRYDKWNISGFDRDKAAQLCADNVNPLVSVLLTSRGYTEIEDVKQFLDEKAIPSYDPYLMADMDKAVARIQKAIADKEFIAIYGDYDVDGMTSAALLALWLESRGAHYDIYIPGRFDEGYGLNEAALDTLKERGAHLIITVDCGVTAVSEVQHAIDIGLDVIVTDHHECKGELPQAAAVVDPKRPDCPYPFKSLAGVGVVFKLICALEGSAITEDAVNRYGQLVALGTIADVMPVTGENRRLVLQGMRQMNLNPIPGLRSLIEKACTQSSQITAMTISYILAPRLNAAGRMSDPLLSVKLLLSSDGAAAAQYVDELDRLNDERRQLEQEITEEALKMLARSGEEIPAEPIVLAGKDWYQGVTGIVASKLADRFKLPTVIISIGEDGLGRGSCRSCGSFSIYDALRSCSELLITFGGHEMAAGVTVAEGNIGKLRRCIAEIYSTHTAEAPETGLEIDFEVEKPELLSLRNVEALKCLEPFGRGNEPARLCITGASVIDISPIGSGKHTKLKIEKAGSYLDCVFFSVPPESLGITYGDIVDIAFEPQVNEYRGRRSMQLQLADIRNSSY